MAHRYFVEWSAGDYRKSGMTTVMANNQPEAVKKAKQKLGAKVKKDRLSKFRAWKDDSPKIAARRRRNVKAEEEARALYPNRSIHRGAMR